MRLAKYLAHCGVASRRAAAEIVRAGRVTVDGVRVVNPAREITTQRVELDGTPLAGPEEPVVYALNKPLGVVSTASDTHGRATVTELVDTDDRRLYPVGRLDADTSGLLLLTNDGELANLLTHPRYEVEKTYRVSVSGGGVGARALRRLREGVELDDGRTAPADVRLLAPTTLEIVLREGRKRQIRRMCAAVGHPVAALERVRFGPLELGRLRPGGFRVLGAAEVASLRAAARQ
jgi:23S rRNA pseudouridine2605 synthase